MAIRKLRHEEIPRTALAEIGRKPRHPIVLVLDNVRSLYNVGSIFRTCDGALIERLYLCGFTPHPPRKEIEKTALDAAVSVPWVYHGSVENVLRELKSGGYTIAALELAEESTSCFDLKREHFPLALVIGNEIEGVRKPALDLCDLAVEIPMYGIKQSLNVAIAAGIGLYEALRVIKGK